MADDRIAHAVEALAAISPRRGTRTLRESNQTTAEHAARSCYDHLAGELAVAITDRLCTLGALERDSLGLKDPTPFLSVGVDPQRLGHGRRPLTRSCLDWSERRPHLAGALGASLLAGWLEDGWLKRRTSGRAVTVTPAGRDGMRRALDLDIVQVAPGAL